MGDASRTTTLVEKAKAMLSKSALSDIVDDLRSLIGYVKDSVTGDYKGYSTTSLLLALAALIYLVSPIDAVPDVIPGGLLDDAAILAYAIKQLRDELVKYRLWKK